MRNCFVIAASLFMHILQTTEAAKLVFDFESDMSLDNDDCNQEEDIIESEEVSMTINMSIRYQCF